MNKDTIGHTIAEVLARHSNIQLGILFGSAASGTMRPDSDIDVAVLGTGPLPVALRLDITAELSLALRCEIDLIDLHDSYGTILRQIIICGEVVFKRNPTSHAMLIKRMLLDQADMGPLRDRITTIKRHQREWLEASA